MRTAGDWIQRLQLVKHPEGGYYRETYRSAEVTVAPLRFAGKRSCSTAIYFLLPAGEISALHRIKSDEVWHFYDGGTLAIQAITAEGWLMTTQLGLDDNLQFVVPAGNWFGAEVIAGDYVLAGCTVAPGFDFRDFEMADRSLSVKYPQHRQLIKRLTKSSPNA